MTYTVGPRRIWKRNVDFRVLNGVVPVHIVKGKPQIVTGIYIVPRNVVGILSLPIISVGALPNCNDWGSSIGLTGANEAGKMTKIADMSNNTLRPVYPVGTTVGVKITSIGLTTIYLADILLIVDRA